MEKKYKSIKKEFPPVKIYLDELKNIETILKERLGNINIETDDYKFADVEELTQLGTGKIKSLDISASNPYFKLSFRPQGADVYFADDNLENRGLASLIEDIILKCKRKIYIRLLNIIENILIMIITLLIVFYYKATGNGINSFLLFLIFAISFSLSSILIRMKTHTVLFLKDRKDEVKIFVRNKDKLILIIFSSLLSIGLTILAQSLIKK